MSLQTVSTWLSGAEKVPSPAQVISTSDWYLLNHLTGKLIQYDHLKNRFEPMIAESWTISDSTYTFKLRADAVFSDGSTITAEDVAASIKFLILQRTSTHFPVWEYFPDCDQIRSFNDVCESIVVSDQQTISFKLRKRLQSFFLLLTSPEGGIWSKRALTSFATGAQPTHFSGPYLLEEKKEDHLVLASNPRFTPLDWFSERPGKVLVYFKNLEQVKHLITNGQIQIYFEAGRPFAKHEYEPPGFKVMHSAPSTVLYLFRVGKSKSLVGRAWLAELWQNLESPEVISASSFLPFTSRRGIDEVEFLKSLPRGQNNKAVRIAVLRPYFSDGLLTYLESRARKVGLKIEFISMQSKDWFQAFKNTNQEDFDFILSAYVASERFPSVQLRYLLEGHNVPYDLSLLDNPDWSEQHEQLLKKVQKFVLREQLVIPLFFVKNQIRYSPSIDVGDQPVMDADIQLWRLKKAP